MLMAWLLNKEEKHELLKDLVQSYVPDAAFVGYITSEMVEWLFLQDWFFRDFRRMNLFVWHRVDLIDKIVPINLYEPRTIWDYEDCADRIKIDVVTHGVMNYVVTHNDWRYSFEPYIKRVVMSLLHPETIGINVALTQGEEATSRSFNSYHTH
jgi:hypothetical protein